MRLSKKNVYALVLQAAILTGTVMAPMAVTAEEKEVTLRFFSNLPDRTQGEGFLEQTQIDAYMEEHPNVKVEVEALQDDSYEAKLQAYMQSGNMPDVFNIWAAPYFFEPLTKGSYAAELNAEDYQDWNYTEGALEAFTKDGKLYGLPKTVDFWTVLYNENLFKEYGVEVPTTVDEYIEAAKVFAEDGISLVSLGGKEIYTTSNTIQNLIIRTTGDAQAYRDALYSAELETDQDVLDGVEAFKKMVDNNVFTPSFTQDDYGTARNLFIQGQAAMFFCGSWEMGIGADQSIDEEMRQSIRAAKFPLVDGGKGTVDQLQEWFGSGYSVSADSENKETAIEFLNYIMQPDVFAKNCWEQQVKIPPMDFEKYRTVEETNVQKDLLDIMNSGTSASFDCTTYDISASFGVNASQITTELETGMITPEEYLEKLDEAVKQEDLS